MGGYGVQIGSGCVWEGIEFRLAVVVYGSVQGSDWPWLCMRRYGGHIFGHVGSLQVHWFLPSKWLPRTKPVQLHKHIDKY
jgi:hypothetical protein